MEYFNFTSLNLLSILSHLIELAYKPINKYSKLKLPPKFYEMIFENLFNKIHITRFLLNKIKEELINKKKIREDHIISIGFENVKFLKINNFNKLNDYILFIKCDTIIVLDDCY